MLLLYNGLLILVGPFIFPFLVLRGLWRRKGISRKFHQRLRPFQGLPPSGEPDRMRFWVHASSVGEVRVARVLVHGIRERFPGSQIFLSTFTISGLREAEKISAVKALSLAPLDLPFLIRPVLQRMGPDFFLPVESEFWPNLLYELKRSGVSSVLINGRISERAFKRYRVLRFFFRGVLLCLDRACMRNPVDAERITQLGVPEARVRITGNLKFDSVMAQRTEADPVSLKKTFRPRENGKVVLFANTREGEEELLMPCIRQLVQGGVEVMIAPRHVERTGEIERLFKGEDVRRWSDLEKGEERRPVTLLDRMGILFPIYGICDAAFVGGSLLPFGGQNILEPAVLGRPVLFGRYMQNFEEEARILKKSGGGIEVSAEDIFSVVTGLLERPEEARRRGEAAARAVAAQAGALERCLEEISSMVSA